jgi:hypothetical protein
MPPLNAAAGPGACMAHRAALSHRQQRVHPRGEAECVAACMLQTLTWPSNADVIAYLYSPQVAMARLRLPGCGRVPHRQGNASAYKNDLVWTPQRRSAATGNDAVTSAAAALAPLQPLQPVQPLHRRAKDHGADERGRDATAPDARERLAAVHEPSPEAPACLWGNMPFNKLMAIVLICRAREWRAARLNPCRRPSRHCHPPTVSAAPQPPRRSSCTIAVSRDTSRH